MARTDLAPADAGSGLMMFGTNNPEVMIQKATKCAQVLAKVVESQKMFTMIGQGKHLRIEAWQTLGAMTGVTASTVWTRKLDNGWEARAEAKFRGEVITAAESECLNVERNWANKEDHALRSMAQTRAMSKALGAALRFIVTLAGYNGTPAEEMPESDPTPRPSDNFRRPQERTEAAGAKPTGSASSSSGTAGSNKSWTGKIDKVTFREYPKKGADGKPTGEQGKTYTIHGKDGTQFKTWSDTFASDCKYAAENGEEMIITYSEKEYRGNIDRKIETCEPAPLPDDETPPTEEVA